MNPGLLVCKWKVWSQMSYLFSLGTKWPWEGQSAQDQWGPRCQSIRSKQEWLIKRLANKVQEICLRNTNILLLTKGSKKNIKKSLLPCISVKIVFYDINKLKQTKVLNMLHEKCSQDYINHVLLYDNLVTSVNIHTGLLR